MADNRASILSKRLSPEETFHLRELVRHPGFLLYQQALEELVSQERRSLLETSDPTEIYRSQGAIRLAERLAAVPDTLLVTPTIPQGMRR